jgi:hypothetical protein
MFGDTHNLHSHETVGLSVIRVCAEGLEILDSSSRLGPRVIPYKKRQKDKGDLA